MMPTVTIVIPAYNAESTIARAIETALAQTYADLEVVVIDDGSTDATARVALDAGRNDARFHLLRQTNGGVSVARNVGIDFASGTWVAPLDADDAFAPERIATLVERAESIGADLVADNLLVRRPDGSSNRAFPDTRMTAPDTIDVCSYIQSDRPRHGLNSAGFIKPLMRRDFLTKHRLRYPEGFSMSEDFYLHTMCLLHGARLAYVSDALYLYAYGGTSLSRGDDNVIIRQLQSANADLVSEARRLGRLDAVAALEARERDTARWLGALAFERAVGAWKPALAFRLFFTLPSKRYGVYRALGVVRYNILRRLGRTPRPRS
ncbi:MAG: glycosyltransferase family 2 protein [Vulcanimicrobiaceae bacterium]